MSCILLVVTQGDLRLFVEGLQNLARNKNFWLIPTIIVLLLIGLLATLGGSVAGVFNCPIF